MIDLKEVLELHEKWLSGDPEGRRANLSGANLSRANLSDATLSGANLSDANLYGADFFRADLSRANLSDATLSGANLYGANLSGAKLSGADLFRANLSGANLSRANLSDATLSGANLYGALGVSIELSSPLALLRYQPGPIRLFKLVTEEGRGPFYESILYQIGKTYEEPDADSSEKRHCSNGLNVATLDWCLKEFKPGYRILIVEFSAADIAAIPLGTDGKLRLRKLIVVDEIPAAEITRMLGKEPARTE